MGYAKPLANPKSSLTLPGDTVTVVVSGMWAGLVVEVAGGGSSPRSPCCSTPG